MNKRFMYLIPIAVILLVSLACTITLGGPTGPSQQDLMNTAVAQTLAAGNQQNPTLVPPPQATTVQLPTLIPVTPPTLIPLPCNKASAISETYPDNTVLSSNTNFVKSWRLQNIGTCTWNANYKIVFSSGDLLGANATNNFTFSAAPGEVRDFNVNMKSPAAAGTYKGIWKLQGDDGQFFATVWVQIIVQPAAPPSKPDMIISEFSLNPAIPTMGQNVHVRVGAYNQGNAAAGAFIVRWYGLSTFTNPSCSWALPGMVAHGGQILECNFVFSSWYPINKTTIVYIDHDNQVAESNEGNNSASKSPFGVNSP